MANAGNNEGKNEPKPTTDVVASEADDDDDNEIRPSSMGLGDANAHMTFDKDHNYEDFSVVWLDASLNTRPDSIDTKQRLRSIINFLCTFDTTAAALSYIKAVQDERVFLIVSGTLGQEILPQVAKLPQLERVYVLRNVRILLYVHYLVFVTYIFPRVTRLKMFVKQM